MLGDGGLLPNGSGVVVVVRRRLDSFIHYGVALLLLLLLLLLLPLVTVVGLFYGRVVVAPTTHRLLTRW